MKLITFVCVSCILAVLAHGASIADESLDIKEANQFLNRAKRGLWEECVGEGCNTHEVWEAMKRGGYSRAAEVREFIYVISGKKNSEGIREFIRDLSRLL